MRFFRTQKGNPLRTCQIAAELVAFLILGNNEGRKCASFRTQKVNPLRTWQIAAELVAFLILGNNEGG